MWVGGRRAHSFVFSTPSCPLRLGTPRNLAGNTLSVTHIYSNPILLFYTFPLQSRLSESDSISLECGQFIAFPGTN